MPHKRIKTKRHKKKAILDAKDKYKDGYFKYRMCSRKKAYPNRAEAEFYGINFDYRAYKCPMCHKWHLTSQFQRSLP